VAEAQSRLRDYFPDYGSRGSLTDAPAETPRTALLEQYGSIVEPYEPSLSERIYNFAFDALGGNTATGLDRQRIQRRARYPQKIIDQTALAGITDYSQAMQDYARGDALSGTTNMAMAATSFIPGQQRQAVEEITRRLSKGTFGQTLDTSNIQVPFRSPISPQTDVPQIAFRSDTPAQGQSALNDLDMSYDARMQRAVDQGYVGPYYHATMDAGDIDEFKPKYRDNLTFVSPTPDFANSWIGKGGAVSRAYDEPNYSMMKADQKVAYDKHASQYGNEIENWPQSAEDDYFAERAAISNQYNASGASVMPLMVRAENTFDPAAKPEVLDELIRNQGYDPEGSNLITGLSNRDAFATGNYLFLENPEVVEFLKGKGFDSMLVGESNGRPTNLALFNTSGIRSEYAAFDPSKKGSSNILAGMAGAGVVGGSALSGQKQEQKQ